MKRTKEVRALLRQANCQRPSSRHVTTDTASSSSKGATFAPRNKADPPKPEKVDYKTDYQTLRKFTDVNIMAKKGKAYPFRDTLFSVEEAEVFPTVYGCSMNGVDLIIPRNGGTDAKIVCFSIKEYGFALVRKWCDPFTKRYKPTVEDDLAAREFPAVENSTDLPPPTDDVKKRVTISEVVFIEYSFLWFARNSFTNLTKKKLLPQQLATTILAFGPIQKFANAVELPSKMTGYVFLLDNNDKIRWKGSGEADNDQLQTLYRLTEELLEETDRLKAEAIEDKKLAFANAMKKEHLKERQENCAKK